jgi:hypothetical protein
MVKNREGLECPDGRHSPSRSSLTPHLGTSWSTLDFVCSTFARFDDAALFSRMGTFEKKFVRGLTGELATKVVKGWSASSFP